MRKSPAGEKEECPLKTGGKTGITRQNHVPVSSEEKANESAEVGKRVCTDEKSDLLLISRI
jgi:hypothetical protein